MSYQTRLVNDAFQKLLFIPKFKVDTDTFTPVECDIISDWFSHRELNRGELFDDSYNELNQRIAKTNFVGPEPETQWMYDKFNMIATYYNDNFFNFELTGYDYIQYTEYEPGGKHEFHMDLALDKPADITYYVNEHLRKITMVLMLNEPGVDFTGGDFQINHFSEQYPETIHMQKGWVLMIPSFMLHRVSPVTSGLRKTLVSWVIGPKFK